MNAFTLDSCPGIQAKNFLSKPFQLDLQKTLRKKTHLGEGVQTITHVKALKTLKQVERCSRVISWITKPSIVVWTGLMLAGGGLIITLFTPAIVSTALATALFVFGLSLASIGTGWSVFGLMAGHYRGNFLTNFSEAYQQQAQQAASLHQNLMSSTADLVLKG